MNMQNARGPDVMGIGTTLREARLRRGISLREISNATKLSASVLELIERNDISRLPGGIFVRGYLRAYAAQVGLDPEQIVKEYRNQFETPPEEEPPALVTAHADRNAGLSRWRLHSLIAVGLIFAIYVTFISRTAAPRSEVSFGSETVDGVSTVGEVNGLEDGSVRADPVDATAGDVEGLQLELQPRGACWVSAMADGRVVVYRLMQAGERATVEARGEIALRIGDAGAFAYLINGAPGRQLGQLGEAVTIRLTKDNSRMFLASPTARELGGNVSE